MNDKQELEARAETLVALNMAENLTEAFAVVAAERPHLYGEYLARLHNSERVRIVPSIPAESFVRAAQERVAAGEAATTEDGMKIIMQEVPGAYEAYLRSLA